MFSFLHWSSNWDVEIRMKTSDLNDAVSSGKANILHLLKGPTGLYYEVKGISWYIAFSRCVAKATESTETK